LTTFSTLQITAAVIGAKVDGLQGLAVALFVEAFAETLVTVPAVVRSAMGSGRHRQGRSPIAAPAQERGQRDPAGDQRVRKQPQSPPGSPPDVRPAEHGQDARTGAGPRRNGELPRPAGAADRRDPRAMGGAEHGQDARTGAGPRRNGEMPRPAGAADPRDPRAMGGAAPLPGRMPPHRYPRPAVPPGQPGQVRGGGEAEGGSGGDASSASPHYPQTSRWVRQTPA
jgi:hypothetical protein